MTASQSGQDVTRPTAPSAGRSRWLQVAIATSVFAVASIVGAYLDWLWWPVGHGLVITIAAAAILLAGGVGVLVSRGTVRRVSLAILVAGVGLLVGQNVGPSREPLVQSGGTMSLRLESPVVATTTSPAICQNVASGTEFQVNGDPNMRLDSTNGSPFVMVYLNVGDRWDAIEDAPRKDGVRLTITIDSALVPDSGKPSSVAMEATASSTLESSFSNQGGSIHFAGLVPKNGPDFTGGSMDLAGTIEWTCGQVVP